MWEPPNRRRFLLGCGALIAAPAVVKAASLMPVRGIVMPVRSGNVLVVDGGSCHVHPFAPPAIALPPMLIGQQFLIFNDSDRALTVHGPYGETIIAPGGHSEITKFS